MEKVDTNSKRYILLFVVISVVGIIINLPYCAEEILSYDSSYQFGLTCHSWQEIWKLLPQDYSPPLYTIIIKIPCLIFGHSLKVMRFTNSLVIMGLVFFSLFPIRKSFGDLVGIACSVVFCCSSVNWRLFQEIRPTYFGYLFVTGAAVYAYCAFFENKKSYIVLHMLFTLFAMYTHNVAMLAVFGIYVVLLLFSIIQKNKKKIRIFLITGSICAIAYIPWLFVLFYQLKNVQTHYWKADYSNIGDINKYLFGSLIRTTYMDIVCRTGSLALTAVLPVYLFIIVIKKIKLKETLKEKSDIKNIIKSSVEKYGVDLERLVQDAFLVCLVVLPVLVFEIITRTIYPFVADRYYYMFTGISVLFLTVISFRIKKVSIFVLIGVFSINSLTTHIQTYKRIAECKQSLAQYNMYRNTDVTDLYFFHTHEWTLGVMCYLYPNAHHYICEDSWVITNDLDVFNSNVVVLNDVSDILKDTNSIIYFSPFFEDFEFSLTERLENQGITCDFSYSHNIPFSYGYSVPVYISLTCINIDNDENPV